MENRIAVAAGHNPIAKKRRSSILTLAVDARRTHAKLKPRWRNRKHADSWMQTLERHAFPILGAMAVDHFARADVLAVLTPIWGTRPETGRRICERTRAVLHWSWAHRCVAEDVAGEMIDGVFPETPSGSSNYGHQAIALAPTVESARTVGANDSPRSAFWPTEHAQWRSAPPPRHATGQG